MILTTSVKTNATNAISLIIILSQQFINNRFIVSNPSFPPSSSSIRNIRLLVPIYHQASHQSLPHLLRRSTSEAWSQAVNRGLNALCALCFGMWGGSHGHTCTLARTCTAVPSGRRRLVSPWPESRDGQRARWADSAEVDVELCHSWSVSASRLIPCLPACLQWLKASFRLQ